MLCTTLKPNGKFCMGLRFKLTEGIVRLECISLLKSHLIFCLLSGYLHLFCTQMCTVFKGKKWKCDSDNLFKRKLVVYFVLHYSSKRFFRTGFDPELRWQIYLRDTDNLFFVCTHAIEIRRVFLFVSIIFMLEKVFVRFLSKWTPKNKDFLTNFQWNIFLI